MAYLLPTEYEAYGLAAETTDDWVTTASSLMEAYCHRPTLLTTTYTERLRVTAGSQTVRVSYLPLVVESGATSALVSAQARLSRGRKGDFDDPLREQIAWVFGAPGSWTTLNVTDIDTDLTTGELTLPGNFLGLSYNEVQVAYMSGVDVVTPQLKVACAQIVRNAQTTPGLNVRSSKVDTLTMQYFSDSLLDEQVKALLRPYLAQRMG